MGGHIKPNSKEGDKLEWKNLQKKEMKKNTSDVINKIIPNFKPWVTCEVWNPS